MDGTAVTNIRTGAAGAVAAKHLARPESEVVTMVGAGAQAKTQLLALAEVFEIKEVRVNDISRSTAKRYVAEVRRRLEAQFKIIPSTREAVKGADVVVTTTPSRKPIVKNGWISAGTHINAIGADAPGKQELDPKILLRSKVVVDDIQQALHSGEVNVPLSLGLIARADIYGELGEIVTGRKPGRTSEDEITVFDSTGLAVQDIATDWVVYQKAKRLGKGRRIELLGKGA
jgi:alanine dehydrogenase